METKLNCNAKNCVHNINGLCSAKEIHVAGMTARVSNETQCDNFVEKGFKNAVYNLTNMNVAGEIKQVFSRSSIQMSPIINCSAINCTYNDDKKCTSPNIVINGDNAQSSDETECQTYTEK